MTQSAIAPLNPATTSGTELADKLVDFEQAVLTQHSASSAPSYIQAGTLWLDTTTNPNLWKFYDGVSDIILAKFNTTSHRRQSPVNEATVASAATTDVLGSASEFVAISGSATITSLGSEPNQIKYVRATGAFTLTHHATTLILPSGANIVAASGDTFIVVSDSSGNARVFGYQKASGASVVAPTPDIASGTVMLFFQAAAPTGWTKDTSNFNDHAIRIVTGTPSSGGSLNFSTVFGKSATDAHTLTTSQIPSHTHGPGSLAGSTNSSGTHTHSYTRDDGNVDNLQGNGGNDNMLQDTQSASTGSGGDHTHSVTLNSGVSGSNGSDGSHTHNMDIRVRYVDAIRATKN